jgi:hypothetical protein
MSTKRIYRIEYDVYWKHRDKRTGFWSDGMEKVITPGFVKDAILRAERFIAKGKFSDKDEDGTVNHYYVGKINVSSVVLETEAEIS